MTSEYTFVCIEEEELNKLKNIAYNLKCKFKENENIPYNEIINKINRIEKKALQQELFVYDLNGELKYFELELQRKYEEQLFKLDDFKLKCIELFKLQKEEYTRLIEEQNNKIDFILNKIKEDFNINNVFNYSQNKKTFAKNLLDDLNKIILKLYKVSDKEQYLKELGKIKYLFNQALSDFEKGFYESSMSISRLVYSNIIDFRNKFIENEEKIYTLFNVLNTKIVYLNEKIKNSRNIFLEYNNCYYNFDVSFWSNELINNLNYQINNLYKLILESQEIQILQKAYDQINEYENKILDILNEAKNNIISSQIRSNIANKCINILNNSDFRVLDYFYIDNDLRKDINIIFENPLKDKFIIKIKTIDKYSFKTEISLEVQECFKDIDIKLYDLKNLLLSNKIVLSNFYNNVPDSLSGR